MTINPQMLASADLFVGLTEEQTLELASRGEEVTYHQNEVIMSSGKSGDKLYIILSGQLKVEHEDGHELVLLGAGQGLGEMALLDAGPRSATIRCTTPEATLLCFPRSVILDFCEEQCCAGYQIMYNLARDLAFKLRHQNLTLTTDNKGKIS